MGQLVQAQIFCDILYYIILYYIILYYIYCNWVSSRWQWLVQLCTKGEKRDKTIQKHRMHEIENEHTKQVNEHKKNIKKYKSSNYKITKRSKY